MAALELEREGPILRVWLDRPECRNALDTAALEVIEALFDTLRTDFETRVVVLGGRGPSFCGGADRRSAQALAVPTPMALSTDAIGLTTAMKGPIKA